MLSNIIKEHRNKKIQIQKEQEKVSQDILKTSEDVSKIIITQLNEGIETIYQNQILLKTEAKKLLSISLPKTFRLHENTTKFSNSTLKWLHNYKKFSDSLKEIGDVSNWAQTIENDMANIVELLEKKYHRDDIESKEKINTSPHSNDSDELKTENFTKETEIKPPSQSSIKIELIIITGSDFSSKTQEYYQSEHREKEIQQQISLLSHQSHLSIHYIHQYSELSHTLSKLNEQNFSKNSQQKVIIITIITGHGYDQELNKNPLSPSLLWNGDSTIGFSGYHSLISSISHLSFVFLSTQCQKHGLDFANQLDIFIKKLETLPSPSYIISLSLPFHQLLSDFALIFEYNEVSSLFKKLKKMKIQNTNIGNTCDCNKYIDIQ